MEGQVNKSPWYFQMEMEREKIPNLLKADFLPVFVVKVLKEKLVKNEEENFLGERKTGRVVRKWLRETEEESTWTDDTWLQDNTDFEGCFLLSQEERNLVGGLLKFTKNAEKLMGIRRSVVGKQFIEEFEFPCLELLYMMDAVYDLMPLSMYMLWLREISQRIYFKRQFVAFVFSNGAFSLESMDRSSAILHRFLETILLCHYCNTCDARELVSMKELTGEILTTITDKLACSNDGENLTNHMIVLAAIKDAHVPTSVRVRYVTEQLTVLFKSDQGEATNLLNIIQCQEKCADPKTLTQNEALNLIFTEFISMIPCDRILPMISYFIEIPSLSWEYFLHFLSKYFKVNSSSHACLKDLIKSLIRNGLASKDSGELAKGFILARHCSIIATEGDQFPRYGNWFMNTFQGENHSLAKDPDQFVFFVETLSKWVQVEPSVFLTNHTTIWPFIPKGCRDLWSEYLTIAKIRIQEYREVEDAMEYEPNPNDPIQHEVSMALKAFEQNGKLPNTIAKMFIFSKQHYLSNFLPALLRKPSNTVLSDSRLRLIELLKQQNKIPDEMYAAYKVQMKSS